MHEFDAALLDRLAEAYMEAALRGFVNDKRPRLGRISNRGQDDMKVSDFQNSKWLTKQDVLQLPDDKRFTNIKSITREIVGQDTRAVIEFHGLTKPWPSNVTGLKSLQAMAGSDDLDDFIGLHVEIYVDQEVEYKGERVGGIKLRPAPLNKAPQGSDAEFDDSIPY